MHNAHFHCRGKDQIIQNCPLKRGTKTTRKTQYYNNGLSNEEVPNESKNKSNQTKNATNQPASQGKQPLGSNKPVGREEETTNKSLINKKQETPLVRQRHLRENKKEFVSIPKKDTFKNNFLAKTRLKPSY